MPVSIWAFFTLFMVAESPGLWDWGGGDFFPPNPKDPRLPRFCIRQPVTIQKDSHVHTYAQCAPTHNTDKKHMASHKSTRGESDAFTGSCVSTGCAPLLQLQPLPSLQLAWRGVLLRGVHPRAVWVSGSCCETGHAGSGIQPVSPSCWPLDPQVPKTRGPAPVAPTYSCWPTRGLVPREVC